MRRPPLVWVAAFLTVAPVGIALSEGPVIWSYADGSEFGRVAPVESGGDGTPDLAVVSWKAGSGLLPPPPLWVTEVDPLPKALPSLAATAMSPLGGAIEGMNEVIGRSEGSIVVLDGSSGRILWSTDLTGSPINVVVEDLDSDGIDDVLAVSHTLWMDRGYLYRLDARTGQVVGGILTFQGWAVSIAVDDFTADGLSDVVLALNSDQSLAGLFGSRVVVVDGRFLGAGASIPAVEAPVVRWSRTLGNAYTFNRQGLVVSDLQSDGVPDVVVTTDDRLVTALDGRDGQTLWSDGAASFASPALVLEEANSTAVIVPGSHGIVAFDGARGTRIWSTSGVFDWTSSSMFRWNGRTTLVTGSTDCSVIALDAANGAILWRYVRPFQCYNHEPFAVEIADSARSGAPVVVVSSSVHHQGPSSGWSTDDQGIISVFDLSSGSLIAEWPLPEKSFALGLDAVDIAGGIRFASFGEGPEIKALQIP